MSQNYKINLFQHQIDVINSVKDKKNVGLFLDLGLGKTITSTVLALIFDNPKTLIVCPKPLIDGWKQTLRDFFKITICDFKDIADKNGFFVINYDKLIRNDEFLKLKDYTLILDESSKICHDDTKRTRFVMKMKPKNTILLSGSPCAGGKYELLYTQAKMLGVDMTKTKWWDSFVKWHVGDFNTGHKFKIVDGYKNTDKMMDLLKKNGAVFMKSEDVINLPEKIENVIEIPSTREYWKFLKKRVIEIGGKEYVGDNPLTLRLYARMFCGSMNPNKVDTLEYLLSDTDERVIVFYSFKEDCEKIKEMCKKLNKPVSIVNGDEKNLENYENFDNSVTLCQFQSASYGLNLQKANKIIYFSLNESADAYIQSIGRIRRIGQNRTCYYYYLVCKDSIESDILDSVKKGEDYNDKLFKKYLEKIQ